MRAFYVEQTISQFWIKAFFLRGGKIRRCNTSLPTTQAWLWTDDPSVKLALTISSVNLALTFFSAD